MDELEKEKLKLEIAKLKAPFWTTLEFWKFVVPTLAIVFSIFLTYYSGLIEIRKALVANEETVLKQKVMKHEEVVANFEKQKQNLLNSLSLTEEQLLDVNRQTRVFFDENDSSGALSNVPLCILNYPKNRLNLRVSNYSKCRGCKDWQESVTAKVGDTISFSLAIINTGQTECFSTRLTFNYEIYENRIVGTSMLMAVNSLNIVSGGSFVLVENGEGKPVKLKLLEKAVTLYDNTGNITNRLKYNNSISSLIVENENYQSGWLELNSVPVNFNGALLLQFEIVD